MAASTGGVGIFLVLARADSLYFRQHPRDDLGGVDQKLLWESFQWIIASIPVITFPVFVVIYTEYRLKNKKRLFALSLIFPIVFPYWLLRKHGMGWSI
jgi:hypothetical protein